MKKFDIEGFKQKYPEEYEDIQERVKERLGKKEVEEYQQLYEEDFGDKISYEEAHEIAVRLVTLYTLIRNQSPEEKRNSNAKMGGQNCSDTNL